MDERYLTILEVSQKQNFIFSSNKLKDNIRNSTIIEWITSIDFFEKTISDKEIFNTDNNIVYVGGGHTILEFDSKEKAIAFVKIITKGIMNQYPDIEVFATNIHYDYDKNPKENLESLIKKLEMKKSLRQSAFHQGSFGIEEIDINTQKPMIGSQKNNDEQFKYIIRNEKLKLDNYKEPSSFEQLGGLKNDTNFIAIIHIDGNAMGKRIEDFQTNIETLEWNDFKKEIKAFSESIDNDFKEAYIEMRDIVIKNLELENGDLNSKLELKDNYIPIRRIITAGDDICFITEGRIGIECAATFIRQLAKKKNKIDGKKYSACAGVTIVHQKYPFYKAYELSESLCSNAKKYGASLDKENMGGSISAIDWHIDFGEINDTFEEVRNDFINTDEESIISRPYIVASTENNIKIEKKYDKFIKLVTTLNNADQTYARGKIKNLRNVLKKGNVEFENYLKFNRIMSLKDNINDNYIDLKENKEYLFDAIEIMDTFIPLNIKEMNVNES